MEEERFPTLERELFDLEDYIQSILQFLPTPMAFVSPLGSIMEIDSAMEKLTGYRRDEIIGRDILELCSEKEEMASIQDGTLRQEPVTNHEGCAIVDSQGQIIPVSLTTMTRMDEESGEPIGYYASFVDIRERKKAEEALQKSEEHLRSLLRSMEDLVFVVSLDGTFTDYLQPWDKKDLYLPPSEFLGKRFDFVLPENLARLMQSAAKLVETSGEKQQFDYVLELNGEKSWYDAIVSPIRDSEGNIKEALFVARNITERKKMADKVMELYEHEKKLRQELEAEINKRIEFTRLLVHELKTPITPVLSSSELLLEELNDDALLGLAENINRGARNLNRRIDELLDLAKSEIGTLQINPKRISPLYLFKEISESVMPVASRKHQELHVELPESLPVIRADEDRLRQVVLNLLQNAFKFTPAGGRITLRVKAGDKDLIIEVDDTGRGISQAELSDIFEPYRQKKSIRARLSGLGLGLALSKRLIELHGGNIWVHSEKGKGSTFCFSIPSAPGEKPKTSSDTVGKIESPNYRR